MLITGFPAGMFGTNCYVVADHAGGPAVVIDPGQDAAAPLAQLLAEHDLTVAAVLLTHGHFDHTWSAREVADGAGAAVYIHPLDRPQLADPFIALGPMGAASGILNGVEFVEPAQVMDFVDGEELNVAGLTFGVAHAPGHSEGSVILRIVVEGEAGDQLLVFGGDVLFERGIGRTDLPGGNHQVLLDSITKTLLILPDDTLVLPGHGNPTTIGAERAENPFLAELR